MKVPIVAFPNDRMNFGKIIYAPDTNSSDVRISGIVKALKTPREEFEGKSAEDFYKDKYNLDFYIDKYGEKTVTLDALHNARKIDTGINSKIKYNSEKSFEVGIYNDKHLFDIDDIEIKRQEKHRQNLGFVIIMSILLAAMAYYGALNIKQAHNKVSQTIKPLMENVSGKTNPKLNIPFA